MRWLVGSLGLRAIIERTTVNASAADKPAMPIHTSVRVMVASPRSCDSCESGAGCVTCGSVCACVNRSLLYPEVLLYSPRAAGDPPGVANGSGMPILAFVLALLAATAPMPHAGISVAYAGSLVRVMEGPFARGLGRETGLTFSGEPKGSKEIARLIAAGLRTPDVFISADTKLLDGLRRGPHAALRGYVVFGSARMVIAYSRRSPFAREFAAAARTPRALLTLLADPRTRLGRTDPRLDPKGTRTIASVTSFATHQGVRSLGARILAKAGMFPEENLAVRVETGDLDAGFFYSTEVPGRAMNVIELPAYANLSNTITYAVAVLTAAHNPQAARTFVRYLVRGGGRAILQAAGVRYFAPAEVVGSP